jgi:hypothetical protein
MVKHKDKNPKKRILNVVLEVVGKTIIFIGITGMLDTLIFGKDQKK